MDFGEELFWVALLIIYFFFQVLGGRKKQQQQQKRRQPADGAERQPAPPQREPELDDALKEIRRALGFPDEEPEPEPAAAEVPAPQKPPQKFPPRTTETPRTLGRPSPPPSGRIPVPDKAFKREEAFEKMAELPPIQEPLETPGRSKKSSRRPHLMKKLHDPAAAREAFLMKEIFGPPRAKRRF